MGVNFEASDHLKKLNYYIFRDGIIIISDIIVRHTGQCPVRGAQTVQTHSMLPRVSCYFDHSRDSSTGRNSLSNGRCFDLVWPAASFSVILETQKNKITLRHILSLPNVNSLTVQSDKSSYWFPNLTV